MTSILGSAAQYALHASLGNGTWSAVACVLVEAGVRSVLLSVAVWLGLRVLGIRNVVAQKSAWVLVLVSAISMPVVAPWTAGLPGIRRGALVVLPADRLVSGEWAEKRSAGAPGAPSRQDVPREDGPALGSEYSSGAGEADSRSGGAEALLTAPAFAASPAVGPIAAPHLPASTVVHRTPAAMTVPASDAEQLEARTNVAKNTFRPSLAALAALGYLLVTAVLLMRLGWGLFLALRLWVGAEPVLSDAEVPGGPGIRVRSSEAITSPVTVGSGIVLPADYEDWDTEKLRIVLAHERAHVRQGDFYLQVLAGLYTAMFWVSPLGWWLRRTLSDLGEAISDRAGLDHAASRTSYARILLQFAAMPHRAEIGVAMARNGSFTERIERLLNENHFRQAFTGGKGRLVAALLLVPAALFAATALVRVEAKQEAPPPPPTVAAPDLAPAVIAPPPPPPAMAAPAAVAPVAPAAPPVAVKAPKAPPVEPVAPEPPPALTIYSPNTLHLLVPKMAVRSPVVIARAPVARFGFVGQESSVTSSESSSSTSGRSGRGYSRDSSGRGYSYSYSSDGNSYALITGKDKGDVHFSGNWFDGRKAELDKARQMAHGDFLWFTRDGKSYVVDDPATVSQIESMYKPMEELGRQQEELGKQQEALGREQEELGSRQEKVSIPAPDISKEMAALTEQMAKLQALKGGTVTQEQLADLQGRLGDLQGKLGELQGRMGSRMGEFGAEQGKLGARQGELGAKQGKLGEEQGRLAREADRKVKSIIDESLQRGKARLVE